MRHVKTGGRRREFEVVLESGAVQGAMMVLPPGGKSDEEVANEHPGAEQWMYVVEGTGRVRGRGGRGVKVGPGSLVLIERREAHQVENVGTGRLVTVNFYCPPAYTQGGEVRKAVTG